MSLQSLIRESSKIYAIQTIEESELSEVLTVNDVKITPGYMHFENAYEGKQFQQKLTIQNCGKKLVFIRLSEPSSAAFEYKSIVKGTNLSPGIEITRVVKYAYTATLGVLKAFASIWIDEKCVTYRFMVTLSAAVVSVSPQQLDFGRMDVVNHAATNTFYIKNSGCKGTMFSIDLGRHPLELVVYPMKGSLPASSSVLITVEIMGTKPGDFVEEFWIKTDPPMRVVITGEFIMPKLIVRRFIHSLSFTFIDFTPTYYGASYTETILMKNFSSSHSMFCVMAVVNGTTMTLDEAKKVDDNYRNFDINPPDGRLAAHKGAFVKVTFAPIKTRNKDKNYCACFLKVIRIGCRDITDEKCIAPTAWRPPPFEYSSMELVAPSESVLSIRSIQFGHESDQIGFESSIGMCLHGEKELCGVTFRPTELNLNELTLEQKYQRELLIVNKSKKLPIKIKYNKVASIDVRPAEFDLAPGGRVEVLVVIRTTKLAAEVKKVTFDLLGKCKNITKIIATASLKIAFETSKVAKKPHRELCVNDNDLSEKLEPEFPYRLNAEEVTKKNQDDDFYLKYMRSLQKDVPKMNELQDYDLTNGKLLLRENTKCEHLTPVPRKLARFTPFIHLPPRLLFNIKINPRTIKLQKLARYTSISNFFEIDNRNIFPIQIFTKSMKPSIVFSNPRQIIKSKEKKLITFNFSTTNIGKYNININVLINGSTLYELTVIAYVVPKTLKVEADEIKFLGSDDQYKFFRVINLLNAHTYFSWEVPQSAFKIYPNEGTIRAERSLLCAIEYNPDPSEPRIVDCVLTSESGHRKIVSLSYAKRKHSFVFDNYTVDVGAIPLNVQIKKKINLKNLNKYQITFRVLEEKKFPGINIEPKVGTLQGLDSQVFVITILISTIIGFSTDIDFYIEEETVSIKVGGTVEFPSIRFQPAFLNFRKISPYSFDTLAFKIKNLSKAEIFVAFPLEDFPAFSITYTENDQLPSIKNLELQPQQGQILFLHFHPQYTSTYSFYLPYVINDILGPVHVNIILSKSPQYFLEDKTLTYRKVAGATYQIIPKSMRTIRVNASAIDKSLSFSNLNINFVFYGESHYSNFTSTDFEICNATTEAVSVCIRIDDLERPFHFEPRSDTSVEFYDVSYKIDLEPNEIAVFQVEFHPLEIGEYALRLPIFVRNYCNDKIFNYLTIKGKYDTPKIIPSSKLCLFEPLPLRLTNYLRLSLRLKNHFDDCQLSYETDLNNLCAVFEERRKVSQGITLWYVNIYCESLKARRFDSQLIIQCSCKAQCSISVTGVAENCLLTTHAYAHMLQKAGGDDTTSRSLIESDIKSWYSFCRPRYINTFVNKNKTCYPLFPSEDDQSDYGKYMRNLQNTLEYWISSQGFYMKGYYKIPEGFSEFCKIDAAREEMRFGGYRKAKIVELPILQLFVNYAGPKIRSYLAPKAPATSEDERAWLAYIYKITSNSLHYVRDLSAYMPHVKTKFLLNYEQYVLYEKIKHPNEATMTENIFYRLSKQCWMDFILQIIKVFVFYQVIPIPLGDNITVAPIRTSIKSNISSSEEIGEDILNIGIYGDREKRLMDWLQESFDRERVSLWSTPPQHKQVIFLDEDLRDGLILGAITARYCPYVRSQIQDMYTSPGNPEEVHHNICTLIKTWKMLKFSYNISPTFLQTSSLVEMLLLIVYLYSILPNYWPKDTITIEAPLTQTNITCISLQNLGDDPIVYQIVFFGNENQLFTTARDVVTVPPRSTKAVKVKYHAKTVATTTATLLFSGETPGQKYGRSVVVTMVGTADVSFACMEIPLTVDLYKPCQVTLQIESPFKVKAEYSVLIGYQPASKEQNVLFPWEEIKSLKIIKDFMMENDLCQFDEEGRCSTVESLCCLRVGPQDIWFYFTNPEVGDWGIKTTITGKVTKSCYEDIEIVVPKNYDSLVCRCLRKKSVNTGCPVILNAPIPMKNNLLWNARKAIMLHHASRDELKFWSKRIFTATGTRIIKLILNSETHPLKQTIVETVDYTVEVDPGLFVTLKKVTFEDVTSEEFYDLPIHPLKDLLQLDKSVLRLVSADKIEKRFYRFSFTKAE